MSNATEGPDARTHEGRFTDSRTLNNLGHRRYRSGDIVVSSGGRQRIRPRTVPKRLSPYRLPEYRGLCALRRQSHRRRQTGPQRHPSLSQSRARGQSSPFLWQFPLCRTRICRCATTPISIQKTNILFVPMKHVLHKVTVNGDLSEYVSLVSKNRVSQGIGNAYGIACR